MLRHHGVESDARKLIGENLEVDFYVLIKRG
jgi:hypothetical protein